MLGRLAHLRTANLALYTVADQLSVSASRSLTGPAYDLVRQSLLSCSDGDLSWWSALAEHLWVRRPLQSHSRSQQCQASCRVGHGLLSRHCQPQSLQAGL